MKKLLFFLLIFSFATSMAQTKTVTIASSISGSTQPLSIFEPASGTSKYPVLFTASGTGETGTMNFAAGSIPAQLVAGKTLPASWLVINIHKPNDGNGMFQGQRYVDAYNWMVKTYPNADLSRVYMTGLSLSGGAIYQLMADSVFGKKIAAFVPVAGTMDVGDAALKSGVAGNKTLYRVYGSSTDDNLQTRGAFTHYIYDLDPSAFIDTKTNHSGTWTYAYDMTKSDLFTWLLTKSRPELAPVLSTIPVTIPTKKISGTVGWYNPDGSLLVNITIYTDGTVSTAKQ